MTIRPEDKALADAIAQRYQKAGKPQQYLRLAVTRLPQGSRAQQRALAAELMHLAMMDDLVNEKLATLPPQMRDTYNQIARRLGLE